MNSKRRPTCEKPTATVVRVPEITHDWNSGAGTWSAGLVRRFYYDGWNLVGESDNFGYRKSFLWGPDLSGTMQGAGGVGGLLSVTEKPVTAPWQVSYAISDANGNVMKLVDSETLATVAEYEYGPFGELIRMTGPRARANPFRYSSKDQDDESGLLYYGYRYYDAALGRWLNRDPIGEEGGTNVYQFVDSLNAVDYLGLYRLPGPHDASFVWHYFFANGATFGLNEKGYIPKIEQPVRTAGRQALEEIIGDYLKKEKCDKGIMSGHKRKDFSGTFEVDLTSVVFSIGRTIPSFDTVSGKLMWCCQKRRFEFEASVNYYIDDWFRDALDVFNIWPGYQEAPGGVPYPITGHFIKKELIIGTIPK